MGGHDVFFLHKYSFTMFFVFFIPCTQLVVTVWRRCYRSCKKASEKALAHFKVHLERSLRPIQATHVTPGTFRTRQKRLEAFPNLNKNLATSNLFSIEVSPQFTEPLKRLCACLVVSSGYGVTNTKTVSPGEKQLYVSECPCNVVKTM